MLVRGSPLSIAPGRFTCSIKGDLPDEVNRLGTAVAHAFARDRLPMGPARSCFEAVPLERRPLELADRHRLDVTMHEPVNRSARGRRVETACTPLGFAGKDQGGRLARLEPDEAGPADELIRAGPADQGRVAEPAVLSGLCARRRRAGCAGPGRCSWSSAR